MRSKIIVLVIVLSLITISCSKSEVIASDSAYNLSNSEILDRYSDREFDDFYYAEKKYVLVHYFSKEEDMTYFHIYNRETGDFDEICTPAKTKVVSFMKNELKFIEWETYGGSYFGHIPMVVSYSRDKEDINSKSDFEFSNSQVKEFKLNESFYMKTGKEGKLLDIDVNKTGVQFTFGPPSDDINDIGMYFAAAAFCPVGSLEYNNTKEALHYKFQGTVSDNLINKIKSIEEYGILQPVKSISVEKENDYTSIYIYVDKTLQEEKQYGSFTDYEFELSYYPHYKYTLVNNLPIFEIEWKTE